MAEIPIVDVAKIACALNINERRVQQLLHQGMPRESHGRYDLVKCMMFYIRYLQNALTKKCVLAPDGTYVSEREERFRLLRAKTDLKELHLAERRGQLVAIGDVECELSTLVVNTRAQLMAVPNRVAAELDCKCDSTTVQEVVRRHIHLALLVLSREPLPNTNKQFSKPGY